MKRIEPDRASLEIAHSRLRTTTSLDEMLKIDSLKRVLETVARKHMKRRDRIDVKKLQANDND